MSITTMSYKWYCDNTVVGGANSSILMVKNVSDGQAGKYKVLVSNASGSVTSSNAALVVLDAPSLQILPPQMTTNGFRFRLSGPSKSHYVILASTDLRNWTPISTNAAPSGTVDFTDTSATNQSFRYYKAMLQ